ncbi:MAG: TonB-dependent receptor [Gemmatimonadales bacterium]|nr:TonB-dependent receptor [Gemmatimonadales bacterium]
MRSRIPLLLAVALSATGQLGAQSRQLPEDSKDTLRLAEIRVVGTADALAAIPGSGALIDGISLSRWHVLTVNEALRRVPGVHARDEEGFGLRPNIGIRGLNPTRSTKVLLLEDGIPLTLAPYGDNASYYHPPVGRFARIEVLKGSGQILFGPQTIGGVINYVTPSIPDRRAGTLTVSGGSRENRSAMARFGGTWGPVGAMANLSHRSGDGVRANTGSRLDDGTIKTTLALGAGHNLTLRGNVFRERSNVTYSGLTEAEWAADPRANPFRNDSMLLDRWGASATDRLELGRGVTLLTTIYGYGVSRDWWRQSSNSEQRPNDRSDPACGGMQNLNTTCGNQGRLRDYSVWGVEPRLRAPWSGFGGHALLDAGVRVHGERQERRQVNGDAPTARSAGDPTNPGSGIAEDNRRSTRAYSAFAQNRWFLGRWTVTPGLRLEHVRHERTNRLLDPDVSGATNMTYLVPGLGVTYAPNPLVTLFAGAHRGFAPPRVEDVIDNASGGVVELDAELSWNYEIGVRTRPGSAFELEATAFRLDFENQVVPASVAGGSGATLTSAGRTLHQGLELAARVDAATLLRIQHQVFVEAAWTWLPAARFEGERYLYVGTAAPDVTGKAYSGQNGAGTRAQTSVTGNRLPYAPEGMLAASLGYQYRSALDARIEMVYLGPQFADPLNTTATVPDGQQGVLPSHTVWNAALNYTVAATRSTAFVSVNNLFDHLHVADRTRGLLPGAPRTVQAGITQSF